MKIKFIVIFILVIHGLAKECSVFRIEMYSHPGNINWENARFRNMIHVPLKKNTTSIASVLEKGIVLDW